MSVATDNANALRKISQKKDGAMPVTAITAQSDLAHDELLRVMVKCNR
jgi:hypothetical protein